MIPRQATKWYFCREIHLLIYRRATIKSTIGIMRWPDEYWGPTHECFLLRRTYGCAPARSPPTSSSGLNSRPGWSPKKWPSRRPAAPTRSRRPPRSRSSHWWRTSRQTRSGTRWSSSWKSTCRRYTGRERRLRWWQPTWWTRIWCGWPIWKSQRAPLL